MRVRCMLRWHTYHSVGLYELASTKGEYLVKTLYRVSQCEHCNKTNHTPIGQVMVFAERTETGGWAIGEHKDEVVKH